MSAAPFNVSALLLTWLGIVISLASWRWVPSEHGLSFFGSLLGIVVFGVGAYWMHGR